MNSDLIRVTRFSDRNHHRLEWGSSGKAPNHKAKAMNPDQAKKNDVQEGKSDLDDAEPEW